MSTPDSPEIELVPPPGPAIDALDAVKDLIQAIPRDARRAINVDISAAAVVAFRALPALSQLRPAIVEELPKFDIRHVDMLETYAYAAWYADIARDANTRMSSSPLVVLVGEATILRNRLLRDAEALSTRNVVTAAELKRIRKGRGNTEIANDLMWLTLVFRRVWGAIQGKTAVSEADLQRAVELSNQLICALGEAASGVLPPTAAEWNDLRSGAFTLFVNAYDECRRAAAYLRFHQGDADKFAPALRSEASRRRRQGAQPPNGANTGSSPT